MIKTIKKFFNKLFWFPTDSNILNNKGIIELNARRYESSLTYFKKALKANPKNVNVLNNEGVALNELANMKEGKEADDIFEQSFEKFQKVLKIKPDYHDALNNWGVALADFAKKKDGKEADDLFEQSFEKYQKALEIKPDKQNALYNWGLALYELAKKTDGKEAEDLFNQSFEKLIKAEKIKGGAGTYNIACLYSLKGNVNESLAWLEKCLKNNSIPSRSHILADSDLDNIKNKDDFLTLIGTYR
jgi:tetratricopeptide (TPR) repeat protein